VGRKEIVRSFEFDRAAKISNRQFRFLEQLVKLPSAGIQSCAFRVEPDPCVKILNRKIMLTEAPIRICAIMKIGWVRRIERDGAAEVTDRELERVGDILAGGF